MKLKKTINNIIRHSGKNKIRKCKKRVCSIHSREECQYINVNNIVHDKKEINLEPGSFTTRLLNFWSHSLHYRHKYLKL